ncbi:hypothetical protein F4819DRAFT_489066 [Hypoxylon fuscum]|nr:hypothetical protein F4819DRAFT_489066 [Hypoxylon fuscum]
MQFSTILIASLSAAATVSAGCYSGGDDGHNGNGLTSKDIIGTVCNQIYGAYLDGEDRHSCATDDQNVKWNFYIKNKAGTRRTVSLAECKLRLGNEAFACQHGGESTIDKWQYVSDPSKGQCVDKTSWS